MDYTKRLQEVNDNKAVIVIIPDGTEESKVAKRYLKANAPKVLTEERVFEVFDIGALAADTILMFVQRVSDEPAHTYTRVENIGMVRGPLRPDAELFAEMTVSRATKVSDYWKRGSSNTYGRVDTSQIFAALAECAAPLHLRYIDKGEAKPSLLKLAAL